ncbi:MAG: hypothetical protein EKK37_05690 [Sphingobacteriales bacterium]|nr:MAG: hypothetical protein EKK37_05690 [Sphingobacteriales bacterium]
MTKILVAFLLIASPYYYAVAQENNPLINSAEVINEGVKLHDQGKYKEAIQQYQKVSTSDTNYVWALYELSYSFYADSQFIKAKQICEEALSLNADREREPELYTNYGNILDDLGEKDRAMHVFDSAIQKYPAYSPLYLNKAVLLMSEQKYKEAEDILKTGLLIDPYSYSMHFRLGQTAINQGKIVQSYLSFIAYLMMTPGGRYKSSCISLLKSISHAENDILDFAGKRTEEQSENIQLLEQILYSKIALDKNYKPTIKLDDPISRQIQALFEKMEYEAGNNDFWVQYYIPLFKQFFTKDKFEVFINHIFGQVGVEMINDYNKKHKKEEDALINEIVDYLNQIRKTRIANYEQRVKATPVYTFTDGKLSGKGKYKADGNTPEGTWEFYYPAGNIKTKGSFDENGKRTGTWNFYNFNGTADAVENYKDGELDGKGINYFPNGNIDNIGVYKNGKAAGEFKYFTYAGRKRITVNFEDGKVDGLRMEYFPNENVHYAETYKADSLDGTYKTYYQGGQLETELTYINGQAEGKTKTYYETGELATEGLYEHSRRSGTWKRYHKNGKLKSIESYINGLLEGAYEEYYDNGKLFTKYQNKKGKTAGNIEYYDDDGKLFAVLTYENDILKSAKYFDKAGKEIGSSDTKNKRLELTAYRPDGSKRMQAVYNNKGAQIEDEIFFYANGSVNEKNSYADGQLNGPSVNYYLNGKKYVELNYINGEKDGYYKSYYQHDQLKSEGWYKEGKAQGKWIYYDELGNITSVLNYLNDDTHGYRYDYYPGNKPDLEQRIYKGTLEELTQYDSTGKAFNHIFFPKASGNYILLYPDGKKYAESKIVNDNFDGAFTYFYPDGSIKSVQFYKKGMEDSIYRAYNYGGKPATEGQFKAGKKTGTWKYYNTRGMLVLSEQYINGELNGEKISYEYDGRKYHVTMYKDDKKEGPATIYDENGKAAYIITYKENLPVSYAYYNKNEQLVPEILLPGGSGKVKAFFSNGNLATEFEFIEGKTNGADKKYYSNGKPASDASYDYGATEGVYHEYYPDGKLKEEYNYLHDNVNGPYKEYNNKGKLVEEGNYYNGMLHGPLKLYDENGLLNQTLNYYYGKLLSVKK